MANTSRKSGQVIQKGDRTWLVRIYQGRDPKTGKRNYINKAVHGTKKDAQAYLNKALHEKDMGTFIEPSNQTLDSYLDHWLATAAKPRLRERTYNDYMFLLTRYVRPELGKAPLSGITPMNIQALYSSMQAKGLSARTVRFTHAVLHSALKQAQRWRLIPLNPSEMVELPKSQRREMTALSSTEAARFLKAAEKDEFYALFLVAITTGMRPGEYLGLKWDDVNFEAATISVRRALVAKGATRTFTEPKTSRSRRTIAISPIVVQALKEHRETLIKNRWDYLKRKNKALEKKQATGEHVTENDNPKDKWMELNLVFPDSMGGPMDINNLFKRHFQDIIKNAELSEKKLRPYDLRHSCASILLEAGENPKIVSERLGHASIILTLDTYSHVLPEMQQKAAQKIENLIFGQTEELKIERRK